VQFARLLILSAISARAVSAPRGAEYLHVVITDSISTDVHLRRSGVNDRVVLCRVCFANSALFVTNSHDSAPTFIPFVHTARPLSASLSFYRVK